MFGKSKGILPFEAFCVFCVSRSVMLSSRAADSQHAVLKEEEGRESCYVVSTTSR
jgi:hypothetical protein